MWLFLPQGTFTETLEWKTDVLSTRKGEQRISLRADPRITLDFEYILDETYFGRAQDNHAQNEVLGLSMPMWQFLTYGGKPSAGDITILADLANTAVQVGDSVLLYESVEKNELVTVQSISASSFTVSEPIAKTYSEAFVVPYQKAYPIGGLKTGRYSADYMTARHSVMTVLPTGVTASNPYPLYDGYPLIDRLPVIRGALSEVLGPAYDNLDSGLGDLDRLLTKTYLSFSSMLAFDFHGQDEIAAFRQFLHAIKGKLKQFWLPTWRTDFTAETDLISGENWFLTSVNNFDSNMAGERIRIRYNETDFAYYEISSVVNISEGQDRVNLTTTFPATIAKENINNIDFLRLMRSDTDSFAIKHENYVFASCSFPVIRAGTP